MLRNNNNGGGSRGAVQVREMKQQRVQRLQAKAADLERRLMSSSTENNNGGSNNNKQQQQQQINVLRMNLCEALSDILLLDASAAAATDCVGRLWRQCFYARIGPARTKLAKEKKKKKSTPAAIAKQEENLQIFLGEGVTLYDFLLDKLQYKLANGGHADETETETQDSMISDATTSTTEGIVPCLHRLYIHLGDLYRYSSLFQKAEKAYFTAARLGPAFGHAYNQLAVVSQVKDGSNSTSNSSAAVSIYWYARALAASQEPFPTAKSNLKRLYANNREWLLKQHAPTTEIVLAGNASRLFLAQFVDLQFHLLSSKSSSSSTALLSDAFYNHLGETVESFQQLLQASAFGDSLLCKLVAIMAYSEDDNKDDAALFRAARTATLELGQCLADRVATIIENKLSPSSSGGSSKAPSLRVLLPLLLLTEYLLEHQNLQEVSMFDEIERHDNAASGFWKTIVQIFNQLQPFAQPLQKDDKKTLKEYQALRGFAPFDSFLKLYDDSVADTGYLCDQVAIELLEVDADAGGSQQSGTQESTRHSQTSSLSATSTQVEAGRIKIQHFVGLKDKLLRVSSIRENTVDSTLEWIDGSMETTAFGDDDGGDDIVHMSDDDADNALNANKAYDDEDREVLVYHQGDGGGPALLVPGALLQSRSSEVSLPKMVDSTIGAATPGNAVGSAANTGTSGESIHVTNLQQPSPVGGPNVVLQQGFVGTPMSSSSIVQQQRMTTAQQFSAPTRSNPSMNQFVDETPVAPYPRNGPVLPPPGFAQPSAPQAPGFQHQGLGFELPGTVSASRIPTVGESYYLFGGPESLITENPFAADTIPSFPSTAGLNPLSHQQAIRLSDSAFLQNDAATPDGTPLLESGLLSSLLMDDNTGKPSTKNPFAT